MLKADMSKTDFTIDRISVITSESAFTLGGTVKLLARHERAGVVRTEVELT